jgi:glycolate oxidase FAD binding subunit
VKWQLLESILSPDQLVAAEQNRTHIIDGFAPLPVVFPHTIEQLAETIRFAATDNLAIIPCGGGSKLNIGNLPRRASFFLSTARLNNLLEHQAADLTTSVQAGCTLATLQAEIGKHGQCLPIDAPYRQRATLGGIVAANSYGALRYAFGSARDWLIGVKVIHADSSLTKAGGKVVKNVAGYDLMKLYTGSFGTLAVIVEMNFKLRPRPAAEATIIGFFHNLSTCQEAARSVMSSQLLPASLDLFTPRALKNSFPQIKADKFEYALAARLFGSPASVAHQLARIAAIWPTVETAVVQDESAHGWQRAADYAADNYAPDRAAAIVLRAATLPSQLCQLVAEVPELFNGIASDYQIIAHAGNGVLRLFVEIAEGEIRPALRPRWRVAVEGVRAFCARTQGSCVIEQAPVVLREVCDAWGDANGGALMRTIKNKLDPQGTFSPGRFAAGI